MADILDIGKQCSQCSRIDFLPIQCPNCSKSFCNDHISSDAHSCQAIAPITSLTESSPKLQRCAVDKCNDPTLNAYGSLIHSPTCDKCQQSFCAKHRDPAAHACSPKSNPSSLPKNQTARNLLAKHFPSAAINRDNPNQTRLTTKNTDPAKQAQMNKLELMKMRHRAVAVDPRHDKSSVPVNRRRIFKARAEGKSEKIFWVEQTVLAGKVFDLLAPQLGISSTDSSAYQIYKASGSDSQATQLRYDALFAEQLEDGDSVLLRRQ